MNTIIPVKLILAGLILIGSVYTLSGVSWQTERTTEYQPYRFTTPDGDTLYFGRIVHMKSWSDHYLIVLDAFGDDLYLLDTIDKVGKRVGREGNGPGEYRSAISFSTIGDTLAVIHGGGYQITFYTLPSIEFIRKIYPKTRLWDPLWEREGTLLSSDLPWKRRGFIAAKRGDQTKDGLFGRFTTEGELLEIFGIDEFDPMEKYNSERDLVRSTNWGELAWLPSGNVVFAYSCRPWLLEYTPSGQLVAKRVLAMPWNDDQDPDPFWSNQRGKWIAQPFIQNMEVTDSGILIGARSWNTRGDPRQGYVALYDWEGNLKEIIHLPKRLSSDDPEGLMNGVTELSGEYWVAIDADPNIRKLIVR